MLKAEAFYFELLKVFFTESIVNLNKVAQCSKPTKLKHKTKNVKH